MPYRRARLALLVAGALVLLFGPIVGGRADSDRTSAGAAAPAVAPSSAADESATPDPGSGARSAAATGATGKRSASPEPASRGGSRRGPAAAGAAKRTGSAAVALTFDDGPDPVQTPVLLDLLRRHGVKATFCLVGFRVRDHPDVVRRIAAEGHTLCNHSWQHLVDLADRPMAYIRWDLESTNRVIKAAVPAARIAYFRAPGGNFTPALVGVARAYGMKSIYWDVDPRDWDHSGDTDGAAHVARVVTAVQEKTRPGSIVLAHDNRQPTTIEACRTLLPWLKSRFRLVALPA